MSCQAVLFASYGSALREVLNVVDMVSNLNSVPEKLAAKLNDNSLSADIISSECVAVKVSYIVTGDINSGVVSAVSLKYKTLSAEGIAYNVLKLYSGSSDRNACKVLVSNEFTPHSNGSTCSSLLGEYDLRVKTYGITVAGSDKNTLGFTGLKSNGCCTVIIVVVNITELEGNLGVTGVGEVHSKVGISSINNRNTAVEACKTAGGRLRSVVKEGEATISYSAAGKCYESSVCAVRKNYVLYSSAILNVNVAICLTVRSFRIIKRSTGSEGDNIVHINELALVLAKNARLVKTVTANVALILTGKSALALAFLIAIVRCSSNRVITTLVYTVTPVVVVIALPINVMLKCLDSDLAAYCTVARSCAIAVISLGRAYAVYVAAVFTSVAVLGGLVDTHLGFTNITCVILIVIITIRHDSPAICTPVTVTLNVFTYRIAANITLVVVIVIGTIGNGTATVVTAVTAGISLVNAHLSATNVTLVICVSISTTANGLTADITLVVVSILALGKRLATVITIVLTLCSLVLAYGRTAGIASMILVSVHTVGHGLTTVTALVLALGCCMITNDLVASVTNVILVSVRMLELLVGHRSLNRIFCQCVREDSSAFGTNIVLIISFLSTGCLGLLELGELMRALRSARSEN